MHVITIRVDDQTPQYVQCATPHEFTFTRGLHFAHHFGNIEDALQISREDSFWFALQEHFDHGTVRIESV